MTDIALVTARAARGLDEDMAPLAAALDAAGIGHAEVDWDDAAVDWSAFRLAVLRSPWDYTERHAEFLAWLAHAEAATTVLNAPAVVRWNIDKHYLGELAEAGVAVVPSAFIEPGEDAEAALDAFLAAHGEAEFVIKPAIGAGSRDTSRYARSQRDTALAHARRLLDAARAVLVQPYLERVDHAGETALIHIDGVFSHALRKGPLLAPGGASTSLLFAPEEIRAREADAAERAMASAALAALPFRDPLAYARVDLIRDGAGAPVLLELELAEPSLFFAHAPGSADRFAAMLARRLAARPV